MEGTCVESPITQRTLIISDTEAANEVSNAVIAYLPRFYRIAVGRLGNIADAEDAIQNALLLAWKNIKQFKGEAQISTWISAILVNSARQVLRKNRLHRYVSLDDQDLNESVPAKSEMVSDYRSGPEELCRRWELAEKVIQFSRHLSPTLRKTFELRDLHGLSVEETAQAMGIKDNTVEARTKRARAAIRRVLERRHGERLERM